MLAARRMSETAKAELTKDMIEALLDRFDSIATSDGTVKVEFRDNALWMAGADGRQELLGIASLPAALNYIK